MKLKEFKSGIHKQQYEYKSFSPITVNLEWSWDDRLINVLLEQATRALFHYQGIIPWYLTLTL